MFCLNCGAKLEDDAVFCYNCGVRLEEKTEMIDEQSPLPEEQNPVSDENTAGKETLEEGTAADEAVISEPVAGASVTEEPETAASAIEEPVAEQVKEKEAPLANAPNIIFCFNCGAQNTSKDRFCSACGTPLNNTAKNDRVQTAGSGVGTNVPKKRATKKPWKILAIAVVVIGAILLFTSSFNKKEDSILYIKDDSLMSVAVGKSKTKEMLSDFESDEGQAYAVCLSEDGKYLFYPDDMDTYGDSYELRYIRTDKKNADDEKIASDVDRYSVLKNNRVVYLTSSDALYIHDLKDKEKVDADVSTFWISEDEKQILWLCDDGDMYIQDINLKKEAEKVSSNVSNVVDVSPNFDYVIYSKDEDLYVLKNGKDAEKICSDYESAYAEAYDDGYEIYYVETEEDTAGVLADYVVDDMEKTDKAISKPDISDYETEIEKPSFWGNTITTEVDDAYYDLMDQYDAKVERDNIREYLSSTEMSVTNVAIFYLTDKIEKTKIAEGIIDTSYMHRNVEGNQSFLTYLYCPEDIEKVKLSDLYESSDYYYLEEDITKQLKDNQYVMLLVDGKTYETGLSADNFSTYRINPDKNCIYYVDSEDDCTLYIESYGKNAGEREKIDDEVSEIMDFNNGKVYYLKDANDNGEGDLYCNGERIAYDVYRCIVDSNDNDLLVATDYSDKHNSFTLCKFKGGKMKKIADDIYAQDSIENEDGTWYFLQDYRETGDLVYYNGRNIKVIDTDVSQIIW